jgi:hypothetical protein
MIKVSHKISDMERHTNKTNHTQRFFASKAS